MKQELSEARLNQLMRAAARVFISRGYRRATMADVAREMGVAPGTLYLYVESKEALFHLLAARMARDPQEPLPELPARTPPAGATLDMLRQAMSLTAYAPLLAEAVSEEALPGPSSLVAVLGELYDSAYSRRDGINLIERSSIDWPDMAAVFYDGLRRPLVAAVASYLSRGIEAGEFRPLVDVAVSARFVVEAIAWFAIHRHGDPGGQDFGDDAARATCIDMVAAAILGNR